MKKIVSLFLLTGLLTACDFDSTRIITYTVNEPVFISRDEFRESLKVTSRKQDLTAVGKICFYNGFLYISDPGKGIHIIDNTNPANPQVTGYIELVGNYDLTVHDDLLYADTWIDLVWFDVSNPSRPVLKGRIENLFPDAFPATLNEYGYDYELCRTGIEKERIVVGWELKERAQRASPSGKYHTVVQEASNTMRNAINGSMSRFGLYGKYLYAVVNNRMKIVDLSDNAPRPSGDFYVGNDVETIFPYENKLFMGTPTGLLIYSVENPLQPALRSQISHVYGCDPVVVENDLAYVTVHDGNLCGQTSNELIIIDVSDVDNPQPVVSYEMHHPKGLGIDRGTLFVCDDGLKIFKNTEPQTLMSNLLKHYKGMDGYDVVSYDNTLMMISGNGLYQYDYSDLNNIRRISTIPVKR
ncbi:MAG: hypothetical protein LBH61_04380 [Dysgonamonadaceae bacterium]|jgi:hypothetical protein|nr:hypothetical protein [Dysgonamonadaceae bacterium]